MTIHKTYYNKNNFIILFILIVLGFIYHHKYINELPSHIHTWAQSDRYALALGFVENDLNFFKPQTYLYNHQFPYNWKNPAEKTITAVDFPIHDYVPAVFMAISGNTSPWIFRIYVLLYSLFGLFFLYKLSFAITHDFYKSFFVVVFAATSPAFVYYQGGFLPTIPSLSNAIAGIYFYYRHLEKNSYKYFKLSILFLTLAALARTTFAIPLIAVICIEFIRLLKKETTLFPKLILFFVSALMLLSYLIYNDYLRNTYGSIFLNHTLPPENMQHAVEIFRYIFNIMLLQYFTKPHYFILIFILLLTVVVAGIKGISISKVNAYFSLFTATFLIGCTAFSILMLRQFPAHDYYFLDTFFFPFLIVLILIISLIPGTENKYYKRISLSVILIVSLVLIIQPAKTQEKRREILFGDRMTTTINNYRDSSRFLDSLGIPRSAKMLVMDSDAPNIPFILMQRKGYVVMNTSPENIKEALTWDFDFVVVQDGQSASDLYVAYPDILKRLKKVSGNGKISVYTRSNDNQPDLIHFLGFHQKKPELENFVNFDSKPDSLWQNFNPTEKYAFSGISSGYLSPTIEFGLTYKRNNIPELKTKARKLLFSSCFLTHSEIHCDIVAVITSNGETIYYKAYNIKNLIQQKGVWEHASLLFELPQIQNKDFEFGIYIWNSGKSELFYDDFGFAVY